jgi:hypothetical protein
MSRASVKRRKRKQPGRPTKPHAKRRTTTRVGRQTGFDPVDRGTAELRRKRRAATGHETLSHEDTLSKMLGDGLLTLAQYSAGRDIAELQWAVRSGYADAGSTWGRLLSAPGGSQSFGPTPAAERAARTLSRIAEMIGPNSVLVFAVCAGTWWPGDLAKHVSAGLDRVAEEWSTDGGMNYSEIRIYYLSPPSERPVQQAP